jgi:hypothetical protein
MFSSAIQSDQRRNEWRLRVMHMCNTTTSHPSWSNNYRWRGKWDLDANNVATVVAMVESSTGKASHTHRRKEEEEMHQELWRLDLKCPLPRSIPYTWWGWPTCPPPGWGVWPKGGWKVSFPSLLPSWWPSFRVSLSWLHGPYVIGTHSHVGMGTTTWSMWAL